MNLICTISELGKQLNNREVASLYLLYGEETYLKEYYRNAIIEEIRQKEGAQIELVKITGKVSVNELYEMTDTSSMFGSNKIILIHNSGWFKSDAGDAFDKFGFLTVPIEGIYMIFTEEAAAKNRKMFKSTDKNGICVEMALQTGEMKEKWIAKQFKLYGVQADRTVCRYMADNCEPDFMNLKHEIEKLCLYQGAGGAVTAADVERVCVRVLHSKVFALTDAITAKNAKKALQTLHELVQMGEPIERVYFMICRYFRLMKLVKELINEGSSNGIAGTLKMNPYEASQFMKSAGKYSLDTLKEAEKDCLDYDVARKNGTMDYMHASEILIIKYCGRK